MRRRLLISAGPGEWRAALCEDGVPVELYVVRGEALAIGGIHLGRVRQVLPGVAAALVDIGDARPGFLPLAKNDRLHEGARLIVQIRREAQGGKAARLTCRPQLRAAHLELLVGRTGLSGAEALTAAERDRLQRVAGAAGLRLFAAAPAEILAAEAAALAARWLAANDRAAGLTPPARLDPPPGRAPALAAATAAAPPDAIVADDRAVLLELRAAFPAVAAEHQDGDDWPFDLDAVFDQALAPSLALDGGGWVHVEPTRAGTLIDVDSGGADSGPPAQTALAVNLAAGALIARQIRLRGLGGGIVIDFVGLDRRDQRQRLLRTVAAALAPDPAAPQLLGWTRLGHLELVRPRRGRPLAEIMLAPAPGSAPAKSPLSLAYEALRALARAARAEPGRVFRLLAAPEIAAALAGEAAEAAAALAARLGRPVAVAADPAVARFEISGA